MTGTTNEPSWLISVAADAGDLEHMKRLLPSVSVHEVNGRTYIAHPDVQASSSAYVVGKAATALLAHMTKLLRLDDPAADPLKFEGSILGPPGDAGKRPESHHLIAEGMQIRIRFDRPTLSATGAAHAPSRKPLGERMDQLRNANPEFARAHDIHDRCGNDYPQLWMVWEIIKAEHGYRGKKLDAAFYADTETDPATADHFHDTAQKRGEHRHAYDDSPQFVDSLPPERAREFLRTALLSWVDRET